MEKSLGRFWRRMLRERGSDEGKLLVSIMV